jgi:hypothetical protein
MMAGCSARLCVNLDHGFSITIIGDRLLFSLFPWFIFHWDV